MSGGRRKEEPSQLQLANGALKVSVGSKVLRSDAAWEDKVRWGLAGAHVRGASWDSGTKGQARSWPLPLPRYGPGRVFGVAGRVAQGWRGELRGPSCQARGSSQGGRRVKSPGSLGKPKGRVEGMSPQAGRVPERQD